MIALPFCRDIPIQLRAAKPEDPAIIGHSFGAQLRRRRRERKQSRIDAAAEMGVAAETLGNWENGRSQPEDRLYPSIIRYLGREPWSEPASLSEALIAERRRRGLSITGAATVIGIDEGTLGRWESGVWKPQARSWPKIEQFLRLPSGELKDRY